MNKRRLIICLTAISALLVLINLTVQLTVFANLAVPASGPITLLTPGADVSQAEQMAQLLAAESGLEVHAIIPGCDGSTADMLGLGQGDIAFLAALPYTESAEKYASDVVLVAKRFGYTDYGGQIMAHSDAGYSSVNDLAGKNVSFPNKTSRSGYLVPIFHLSRKHGIDAGTFLNQLVETGTHDNAAVAVYEKEFNSTPIQAGFAYNDVRFALQTELPDIFTAVDVLEETVRIPNDTVSIRPNMAPALTSQLTGAMKALAASLEGKALLVDLYGIEDLLPTTDADYDITRELAAFWDLSSERCAETGIITPDAGGTVTAVDYMERLIAADLPAGVTTDTLRLSISPLPAATNLPDHLTAAGPVFDLTGVVSDTGKLITTLSGPYSLTSSFNSEQLDLPAVSTVGWYYWDGSEWVFEPSSTVDAGSDMLTALPAHFSIWAVLADQRSAYLPMVIRAP